MASGPACFTLEAGALALEGRADESLAAYRRVIDEWREAELRLDLGLAQLERAWLLGSADQEAADGLQEAVRIFSAMGADGLIERLEAGSGRSRERSTAAAPSGGAAKRVAG